MDSWFSVISLSTELDLIIEESLDKGTISSSSNIESCFSSHFLVDLNCDLVCLTGLDKGIPITFGDWIAFNVSVEKDEVCNVFGMLLTSIDLMIEFPGFPLRELV